MKMYKLKILIIITYAYYKFILYSKLSIYSKIINWKIKKEIKIINEFYDLCNNSLLINKKKYKKNNKPKISIISAVYNGEKYIIRFLRSIQYQFLDDIEIIFIDDYSKDNSIKIIEECQKKDERIILIKQKKNKGTLITRNIGALKAKGEYLIFPDPDDILLNKILKICYNIAKLYNIELIRFNIYRKDWNYINSIFQRSSIFIYQPEISYFLFYGLGHLELHDFNICNKFIKRELFLKTLNNINAFYLDQYMIYFEDGFINYALHRNSKSLYLLKKYGYFYAFNKNSITNNVNKILEIKCFLLYLEFILENSKNNEFEKNMAFYFLKIYINNQKKQPNFLNFLKILKKYLISIKFWKIFENNFLSVIPELNTNKLNYR